MTREPRFISACKAAIGFGAFGAALTGAAGAGTTWQWVALGAWACMGVTLEAATPTQEPPDAG